MPTDPKWLARARGIVQAIGPHWDHDGPCQTNKLATELERVDAEARKELLRPEQDTPEAWADLVAFAYSDELKDGARRVQEITGHYLAMRAERDALAERIFEALCAEVFRTETGNLSVLGWLCGYSSTAHLQRAHARIRAIIDAAKGE